MGIHGIVKSVVNVETGGNGIVVSVISAPMEHPCPVAIVGEGKKVWMIGKIRKYLGYQCVCSFLVPFLVPTKIFKDAASHLRRDSK